jgi:hypothetical protein
MIHIILFLIGAAFRLTAISLTFQKEETVTPTITDEVHQYASAATQWSAARWWIAVAVIHFFQYILTILQSVESLTQGDPIHAVIKPSLYVLSHFGFINFVVDFPGWGIPDVRKTTWLTIIFNSVGVTLMAYVIVMDKPLTFAFGCYPVWLGYVINLASLHPILINSRVIIYVWNVGC